MTDLSTLLNVVHQGDCLTLLAQVPDQSVDMILTDLPYGTTYCEFDGVLKNMDRYAKQSIIDLPALWEHYKRVIVGDGAIVMFAAQPFTSALIQSNPEMFKYTWVWEKNKAANHVAVKFQPLKIHEDIVVFSKAGVNTGAATPLRYHPQGVCWGERQRVRKNDIRKTGSFRYNSLKAGNYTVAGTNYPTSILSYDIPSGEQRVHPTQKPVELCEYLIRTYTNEGDVVLDSCAGSGTTGVAACKARRNWILMEINPDFCRMANERIDAVCGEDAC